MAKYKTQNTRRFKRLQAHSLVKFQSAEEFGTKEPYFSNVKDISAGGMRFWSEHYFPENALLRISVWLPALEKPFDALARVVRVRPAASDVFYLSVRFIETNREMQTALNDFIEALAANRATRRYIDDFAFVTRAAI